MLNVGGELGAKGFVRLAAVHWDDEIGELAVDEGLCKGLESEKDCDKKSAHVE